MLDRIRDYLKPVEVQVRECSVNTIITDSLYLLSPQLDSKPITCQLNLDPCLSTVSVDPGILAQVFINLIRNAVDSMDEGGGTLIIKSFEDDQRLHIVFKNPISGSKIENPEFLYLPFDESSESAGLSLSFRLLKDVGGLLSFAQEQNCMVFTVSLPKSVERNSHIGEDSSQ